MNVVVLGVGEAQRKGDAYPLFGFHVFVVFNPEPEGMPELIQGACSIEAIQADLLGGQEKWDEGKGKEDDEYTHHC